VEQKTYVCTIMVRQSHEKEEPGTSAMVPILYQGKGLVCNHKSGRWVIEISMKQMPEKPK
jgi:hypothetical protein